MNSVNIENTEINGIQNLRFYCKSHDLESSGRGILIGTSGVCLFILKTYTEKMFFEVQKTSFRLSDTTDI